MTFVFSFIPTSTPGYVVSSGRSVAWSDIPDDLEARITEAHGRGESLEAVSVAPDGDWFLRTNMRACCKAGPTSRIQGFIQHCAENGAPLALADVQTFTFGPNPDACVVTVSRQGGGAAICAYRAEAIPLSLALHLQAALKTTGTQSVTIGREDSWVFVGTDGSVDWSGVPDSMVTTMKSRARIPIRVSSACRGRKSELTAQNIQSVFLSLADSDHWVISYADGTVFHSLPTQWDSPVDDKARICSQAQQTNYAMLMRNQEAQMSYMNQAAQMSYRNQMNATRHAAMMSAASAQAAAAKLGAETVASAIW
ncbi:hypothetical protein HWV62_12058 [Athelia sp. TMB]|nr:hypothetical protein HWV62_12058 [Athelia sp. TMB]